jgi:ABC-type glycerol-3-phosphate transport system permease component
MSRFQCTFPLFDLSVETSLDNTYQISQKFKTLYLFHGDRWYLLTAGAFISMLLPLFVFFSLQRYLVHGLLAGAVKG